MENLEDDVLRLSTEDSDSESEAYHAEREKWRQVYNDPANTSELPLIIRKPLGDETIDRDGKEWQSWCR
jgi:hypothetical protein